MNPLKIGLIVCLTFPFIITGVILTIIFTGCVIGATLVGHFLEWLVDE
jgi:hypothetical protein